MSDQIVRVKLELDTTEAKRQIEELVKMAEPEGVLQAMRNQRDACYSLLTEEQKELLTWSPLYATRYRADVDEQNRELKKRVAELEEACSQVSELANYQGENHAQKYEELHEKWLDCREALECFEHQEDKLKARMALVEDIAYEESEYCNGIITDAPLTREAWNEWLLQELERRANPAEPPK